jgi:hypothetical protein
MKGNSIRPVARIAVGMFATACALGCPSDPRGSVSEPAPLGLPATQLDTALGTVVGSYMPRAAYTMGVVEAFECSPRTLANDGSKSPENLRACIASDRITDRLFFASVARAAKLPLIPAQAATTLPFCRTWAQVEGEPFRAGSAGFIVWLRPPVSRGDTAWLTILIRCRNRPGHTAQVDSGDVTHWYVRRTLHGQPTQWYWAGLTGNLPVR